MTVCLTEEQINELVKSQRNIIEKFNVSTDEFKAFLLQIKFEIEQMEIPKMSVEEVANAIKKITTK